MLTEEGLIIIGLLIASGLLALGVWNLVSPSTGRTVRRAAPVAPAPLELAPPETEPEAPPAPAGDPRWILERCRQLTSEGRFDESVAAAMVILDQLGSVSADLKAALWQEVAGARDRLGDRDGALAAFREAIEASPGADRGRPLHACASWAAMTARDIAASGPEQDDRYGALAAARAFIATAHSVVGASVALAAVRADLEVDFWPAYERHLHALIADRDHAEAYRLATEALSDDGLPPARRPTFDAFRADTLAARMVALADRALLAIDESREWEAVGALERAETLLRSASALPAERRDEAAAQIVAAYTRLGRRRIDGGEFEEAIDPLMRALRIARADNPARDDARVAMAEALQAVVAARVAVIRDVGATGNRESAAAQAEKAWTLLRSGIAAGAPQEPLTATIARVDRLLEEFGGRAGS